MKVFLDDERTAPTGWLRVRTAEDAIELLEGGRVEVISLDHDLGTEMTGYDVACWIEEQLIYRGDDFKAPDIMCHSVNPPSKTKIMQAINSIIKLKHR